MRLLLQSIAIGAIALAIYAYVLYPLVLAALVAMFAPSRRANQWSSADGLAAELPSVGIVLSAYNERLHIRPRITNLLAANYPRDRMKIYVGSDGSTDGTEQLLREI